MNNRIPDLQRFVSVPVRQRGWAALAGSTVVSADTHALDVVGASTEASEYRPPQTAA